MQRRYAVSDLNCALAFNKCWLGLAWFISGLKTPYSDGVLSTNMAASTSLPIFLLRIEDSYVKAE